MRIWNFLTIDIKNLFLLLFLFVYVYSLNTIQICSFLIKVEILSPNFMLFLLVNIQIDYNEKDIEFKTSPLHH